MKTVHISYFAILREQRRQSEERLSTTAKDARELYGELRQRHEFSLPADRIRVALNGEFAPLETELKEGDAVAFIPPVAGG